MRLVAVVIAIAMLLALASWPSITSRPGAFSLAAIAGAMVSRSGPENRPSAWTLFAAAILNLIMPVYLPREVWAVIDVVAAGYYLPAYRHRVVWDPRHRSSGAAASTCARVALLVFGY
ncbi:hypothetical protein EN866_09180 [Mesorhizobium sp. M2D.F.Ca.ET.223.01.1.1]|uniref:hypothetical protein n=2 Tax=Mesorhizobium TaxID=68287 RepID=UPI000FCA9FF5|nr:MULTISPECIES: hypothetical protein [unclassified Mesorhizobium]TGP16468.1 hypothetical protein EN876_18440 [Mesorhizobium sp. M2D.F.Ca.ET.233.01.1.1]TGP65282.1 hypothetical protein EN869_002150 [Mesorhizobium sp. M2D.F.Ca.ET.226.01.1.1]TGT13395.1 hypothetical protein EN814_05815 [Mesorhizobium sp. M2D.F.Ca.ET.171.01.1.1]TGT94985.1 hypothetical protein EN806_54350 [bacterium M00.F.Ca.ET.163.01.1.1]TGU63796.1 hypothetical protein EN791_005740 [Mesorhizobium sp. M2D.F.Ca.ET.148.01.1.1]TGW1341